MRPLLGCWTWEFLREMNRVKVHCTCTRQPAITVSILCSPFVPPLQKKKKKEQQNKSFESHWIVRGFLPSLSFLTGSKKYQVAYTVVPQKLNALHSVAFDLFRSESNISCFKMNLHLFVPRTKCSFRRKLSTAVSEWAFLCCVRGTMKNIVVKQRQHFSLPFFKINVQCFE